MNPETKRQQNDVSLELRILKPYPLFRDEHCVLSYAFHKYFFLCV